MFTRTYLKTQWVLALLSLAAFSNGFAQSYTWVAVTAEPALEVRREFLGQWLPLTWYPLKSPVNARVKSKWVQEGQRVQEQQVIFQLIQPELNLKLEEASWHLDQKKQELMDLQQWSSSPEYRQAKKHWQLSKKQCQQQEKRFQEMKVLFDMGGVSQDALIQEETQWQRSQYQLQQAHDRFEHVQRKAEAFAIKKVELELRKAQLNYHQCMQKVEALTVKAPVTGFFFSPHLFINTQDSTGVLPGYEVQSDQWLGVVADGHDFGVFLELDERQLDWFEQADILEIYLSGKGFSAQWISTQPQTLTHLDDHRLMKYQLKLKLESWPEKMPRLGQHIQVVASRYSSEAQLTLPTNAIHWHGEQAYVVKKGPEHGNEEVPVKVVSFLDDKVYLKGELKQGDSVGITSEIG